MRLIPFGEEIDFQCNASPSRYFGIFVLNDMDRHFVFRAAIWKMWDGEGETLNIVQDLVILYLEVIAAPTSSGLASV